MGEVGGAALLNLKICDVACGSGHILLSAARRVGFELAKYRSKEDQPTPTAMRAATRDVIRNCIYGVDKNPLAIELCKVAPDAQFNLKVLLNVGLVWELVVGE